MKKIIDNKLYDTETATKLIERQAELIGYPGKTGKKILYKKENGELFFAWEVLGSEGIDKTTKEDAMTWVAKRFHVDEYERIFGKVSE